jgi:hypothetical protein
MTSAVRKINLVKIDKKTQWICATDSDGCNTPLLFFYSKPIVLSNNAFIPAAMINRSFHTIDFVADNLPFQKLALSLGIKNGCVVGSTCEGNAILRTSSICSMWEFSFADKCRKKCHVDVWGSSQFSDTGQTADITALAVVHTQDEISKLCLQTISLETSLL